MIICGPPAPFHLGISRHFAHMSHQHCCMLARVVVLTLGGTLNGRWDAGRGGAGDGGVEETGFRP